MTEPSSPAERALLPRLVECKNSIRLFGQLAWENRDFIIRALSAWEGRASPPASSLAPGAGAPQETVTDADLKAAWAAWHRAEDAGLTENEAMRAALAAKAKPG